ncbi:MAG TPA: amidohydrolase [Firmicutes bacterium]|nr:amidohydrolase [Candidatus Fermentithermobacillaceae bacterium]
MRDFVETWVERNREELIRVSDSVWEAAELGLVERKSAAVSQEYLRSQGFSVETGVGNMETAFVATWGKGKPVIGFLGEFDALPGLSNAPVPYPSPLGKNKPGHGCGHNLLGAAAMGGAIALKAFAEANGLEGTVKYYGTPAEESSFGKTWMVKAGAFDDADIVLTWHPGSTNGTDKTSSLADLVYKFDFYGKTAHAAGDPWNGRSALDAVELMNDGIERMREHIRPDSRIHYVITRGGGAPNVVPDYAQNFFDIRAKDMEELDRMWQWVEQIAKGAAMMTQTRVEPRFLGGAANLILNDVIIDTFQEILEELGPVQWTAEELEFAGKMQAQFDRHLIEQSIEQLRKQIPDLRETRLCSVIMPGDPEEKPGRGSTDVADVSWVVPTGQFRTACYTLGIPGHSWGVTACGGMSIGHKGMLLAAKTLGIAGARFLTDPGLRQAAWDEFKKRLNGKTYRSPIPEGIDTPPLPFEE